MVSAIALLIATIIPLLCAYGMYVLDLYQTRSRWYLLYCFVWGVAAYKLSAWGNVAMIDAGIVSYENMPRFSAPILEEILKGIILVYLVRKVDFTYFVDGAIYGFAAGIGFAIVENFEYIFANPGAVLMVAIARVFSTNLVHATGSGIIGISLGAARVSHSKHSKLFLLGGLTLAMGLHMGFNNLVTRVGSGLQVVLAVIVGLSGTAFIYMAIRRGLQDEKAWIEEKLGMQDRVTTHEAAVVNRLEDVQQILAPLAQRFGSQKAEAIEQFLLMQAKLGILRKTLEVFENKQDEKMLLAVQAQMAEMRLKMDESRRSVGAYCMLYLRSIFPEDASPVWGRLEKIIQERASTGNVSQSGVNLWSALNKRIKETPPTTDEAQDDV